MSEQSAPSTSWTKEQDDFLREQYRAISAEAIAQRIGKTRNAVIGRANRIGLSKSYGEVFGRGAPHSPYKKKPRKSQGGHNATGPELFYRKPRAVKVVKMAEADISPLNGVGVKMWELESRHCRWVVGEPKDLTFCGHNKHNGSSYCENHSALSTQRKA